MSDDAIPRFYLYGEPHRAVAPGFIHLEQLDDRSRPSEWTIRPHAHEDLVQMFVIDSGGGAMRIEDRTIRFDAPVLLLLPAGVVHGFDWTSDSSGAVLTLSRSYLQDLVDRHPDIAPVFARACALTPDRDIWNTMRIGTTMLQRELGWSVRGHDTAVEAAALLLLVAALRSLSQDTTDAPAPPGQSAALVARYRERIAARFRLRESVAVHAAALGTSETSLRNACTRIAGRSPAAMLDERAMLEARRALLYTNQPVAEIGYSLGFSDAAYFTRFFTRHADQSPARFRRSGARRSGDPAT
ncbi:helix-turn-helix domain-containing protein [Sphingomonas sp. CROZ-RG-20F-R02-07]|uniref:helix-turn-helix domain-containing protein n=1 Tax=Sphingomonas sp. CROZ-RG-20F-R02-07 TaxID=2914832 RepID=UPI001F55D524|nr:helix-turn-helix domain-containing protein [Sphingomonas sp. CROZ-RG-20F-R02-07]